MPSGESNRQCRECNADIAHLHPNARYCSNRHRQDAHNRRHRAPPREYRCAECNTDISDRHWNARYCVECIREHRRQQNMDRWKNDPEYRARMRSWQRERYQRDPGVRDKASKAAREWYADPENRARQLARQATPEWRERRNARRRERYASDPEYRDRVEARKRERVRRLGGRGYRRELPSILMRQLWLCALCGEPINKITPSVHVDHIVPVSKGGGNEVENLQAAHGSCNISKGNRV